MSEFKFACPVCGQHITADSRTAGTQLECPTCFQKIIVPQAPSSPDSKLILSASQVGKPRPVQSEAWQQTLPVPARRMSLVSFALFVLLVGGAAGAIFAFREKIAALVGMKNSTSGKVNPQAHATGSRFHPIPTNSGWTLNLSKAIIPPEAASGGIRGTGFICDRATLQGGNLALRQGKDWLPDVGITVHLYARQGEELSGKTVEVGPDRSPPLPKIVLRWKDDDTHSHKQDFTGGYALKIAFGEAVNARIPGKIFLALPDEAKSYVAGTFDAEIRAAPPPKPH
jgi:DNA-directed RNA polymerase subunit RPC12/RpoP